MPGGAYFARLAGVFSLGIIALIIAFVAFAFLLPFLIPMALGFFLIIAVFLAIWAITYTAMIVGIAIVYFFKPMKISKRDKGYAIAKAKEAGRRTRDK